MGPCWVEILRWRAAGLKYYEPAYGMHYSELSPFSAPCWKRLTLAEGVAVLLQASQAGRDTRTAIWRSVMALASGRRRFRWWPGSGYGS